MLIQHLIDVVVCAMIQLLLSRLSHVFGDQELSVLFMTFREYRIVDCLDAHNGRVASVERGRGHEFVADFSSFGTAKLNGC